MTADQKLELHVARVREQRLRDWGVRPSPAESMARHQFMHRREVRPVWGGCARDRVRLLDPVLGHGNHRTDYPRA